MGTYTIKNGDNLWNIAKKYNTTVAELARVNNIQNASLIRTGQVLNIPTLADTGQSTPATTAAPSGNPADYDEYTVKSGDSLSRIAKDNNMELGELLKINGIAPENAGRISIGQKIRLPKGVAPVYNDYVVKHGDSLWKIANMHGMSLKQLLEINPGMTTKTRIFPNDVIRVGGYNQPANMKTEEVSLSDLRSTNIKGVDSNSNLKAIMSATHDRNYAVVDKATQTLTVYSPTGRILYKSRGINTGKSNQDYNTVTYTDGRGKLISRAGNESTPAGITVISGVGELHGLPSFTRARVGSDGQMIQGDDIASSIH